MAYCGPGIDLLTIIESREGSELPEDQQSVNHDIIIVIIIIMQTFIQDFLHTYTYTYVHTVLNNSSVTHKVRCYPTLVTARKQYMRTHPILTALIGIYTKYLHSIV